MSRSRFIFHPQAIIEAREAREWYRQRSERAARGFLRDLASAFRLIDERPKAWQEYASGERRFVLNKYLRGRISNS